MLPRYRVELIEGNVLFSLDHAHAQSPLIITVPPTQLDMGARECGKIRKPIRVPKLTLCQWCKNLASSMFG